MQYKNSLAILSILLAVVLPGLSQTWSEDWFSAVTAGLDNSIYVVGTSTDSAGTSVDIITLKYASDGALLWAAHYDNMDHGADIAAGLICDSEGNAYILGTSETGSGTALITLVKYDLNGELVWTSSIGESVNYSEGSAIVLGDDGMLYITGSSKNLSNQSSLMTLKCDQEGNVLWSASYAGTELEEKKAVDLVVDNAGAVYIIGYEIDSQEENYILIKYDAQGNELWNHINSQEYVCSNISPVTGMVVDDSSNVYVCGSSCGDVIGDDEIILQKFDSEGNLLWENRDNGYAQAITLGPNAGIYITGGQGFSYEQETKTIKYLPDGTQSWVSVDSVGLYEESGTDISVDDNGYVYVTGRESHYCHVLPPHYYSRYFTLRYDLLGEIQWVTTHQNEDFLFSGLSQCQLVLDNGAVTLAGRGYFRSSLYWGGVNFDGYDLDIVVIQVDSIGNENWIATYDGFGLMTDIRDEELPSIPESYILLQNYPNPFNPTTTISYSLPEQSEVILTVFDIRGQEVTELQNIEQLPGNYQVQWNGMNQSGDLVSTGVYFARLQAGEYSKTIKMLYLK